MTLWRQRTSWSSTLAGGGGTYGSNFLKAVEAVHRVEPDIHFVAIGLEGVPSVIDFIESRGLRSALTLPPTLPHEQLAALYALGDVVVSPSEHDGTPNSLIEAMSAGLYPIAGDIESIREWITSGVNGDLFDPSDHASLARYILEAHGDRTRLADVAEQNARLIEERAARKACTSTIASMYERALSGADVELAVA